MPERPSIPADIQREILHEAADRCAVCGTPLPLERAHIIPWHKSKQHKAEDLICLCANCHERADKEAWGEKRLRDYKKRPWVERNFERASSPTEPRAQVELLINMELPQFDERQKLMLQTHLAYLLKIEADNVRIISVRESNSVTVTVELPDKSAQKLLDAYKNKDPELQAQLASFGLIRMWSRFFRDRTAKWVSYAALLIAVLTFLFGITVSKYIGVTVTSFIGNIFEAQKTNPTLIEGIIALLNIALALFVLLEIRILHPIKTADNNTPASTSFRQLLFGWQCLWLTWILFYVCLAVQWLSLSNEITNIVRPLIEGLNVINGFFFYYLFFVLDQPSVSTDKEPNRAKAFRRNCLLTLLVGLILFLTVEVLSPLLLKIWGQNVLWQKIVPAYIAVGMAFFVGRLDSHYLRLPRVILAPLYLYAMLQLYWTRYPGTKSQEINGEPIAIFGLALILKFVVFLTISKLIRHESFRKYFVVADKGLSEK